VFGELQGSAAMADREIALPERAGSAPLQLAFEAAVFHLVDEEERTRTKLHARFTAPVAVVVLVSTVGSDDGCRAECERDGQRGDLITHRVSPPSDPNTVRLGVDPSVTRESHRGIDSSLAGWTSTDNRSAAAAV
jgi:hypothetical protein